MMYPFKNDTENMIPMCLLCFAGDTTNNISPPPPLEMGSAHKYVKLIDQSNVIVFIGAY